jgi:hypothetical protein
VVCTQVLATVIAVFGPLNLMASLGWKWALFVWGYALAWFLVEDRVRLLAYRIFDPERPPLLRRHGMLTLETSQNALRKEIPDMIEILTGLPAHTVGFKMSGKLHDEDYKKFVPLVDAEIAKDDKVNVLAQFHDFHGWDAKALWDDIKFSTTHCTKIKKIALVGEKTWEKWMATVCKPFTMAKIQYFDASQIEAAKAWLAQA